MVLQFLKVNYFDSSVIKQFTHKDSKLLPEFSMYFHKTSQTHLFIIKLFFFCI